MWPAYHAHYCVAPIAYVPPNNSSLVQFGTRVDFGAHLELAAEQMLLQGLSSIIGGATEQADKDALAHLVGASAPRCRFAWESGAKASRAIGIGVGAEYGRKLSSVLDRERHNFTDLQYQFVNHGRACKGRDDSPLFQLAAAFGFFINEELLQGLRETLNHESDDQLCSILAGSRDEGMESSSNLLNVHNLPIQDSAYTFHADDEEVYRSYTVFQAFIMGYYYGLFLNLVDTSKITYKAVDGAWGYRDTSLLISMSLWLMTIRKARMQTSRSDLITILARLFDGESTRSRLQRFGDKVLGIIGKRSILVNSIIGRCSTPLELGGFTILDCDTSGIPADPSGIVKSGIPIAFDLSGPELGDRMAISPFAEKGPTEDFTRHVEADWDGNPDEMLLVFRYKGRRIGSVDPASADSLFCRAYVEPVSQPSIEPVEKAIEFTVDDVLRKSNARARGSDPIIVRCHMAHSTLRTFWTDIMK
ncbi:hypothetical protein FALBO_5258 [Fusarium albosuccineum]|uniref:Uncharacterized protein n=1 Tax=Fusarium albosuccineum TaxID=1237068 RepID=A0A8H4LGT7_9HYPO|nr:hypothetical protein FALBO_5258 [Fusarium albosuccineum]